VKFLQQTPSLSAFFVKKNFLCIWNSFIDCVCFGGGFEQAEPELLMVLSKLYIDHHQKNKKPKHNKTKPKPKPKQKRMPWEEKELTQGSVR
jgi:hypothetical protein